MLREGAAKLEALLAAQRGAFRVVVPLRNDKVSAKSAGVETIREGLSVAEITERIRSQVVGRDGIEPPTPGFSVRLGALNRQVILTRRNPHGYAAVAIGSQP